MSSPIEFAKSYRIQWNQFRSNQFGFDSGQLKTDSIRSDPCWIEPSNRFQVDAAMFVDHDVQPPRRLTNLNRFCNRSGFCSMYKNNKSNVPSPRISTSTRPPVNPSNNTISVESATPNLLPPLPQQTQRWGPQDEPISAPSRFANHHALNLQYQPDVAP
jgi:hypothetical protein